MWESRTHGATWPAPSPELLPWVQALEKRGPEPRAVPSKPVLLAQGIPVPKWKTDGKFWNFSISRDAHRTKQAGSCPQCCDQAFSEPFVFSKKVLQKWSQSCLISLMYCSELLCLSVFFCHTGIFLEEVCWGHLFQLWGFFSGFQRCSFKIPSKTTLKSWFICFRLYAVSLAPAWKFHKVWSLCCYNLICWQSALLL